MDASMTRCLVPNTSCVWTGTKKPLFLHLCSYWTRRTLCFCWDTLWSCILLCPFLMGQNCDLFLLPVPSRRGAFSFNEPRATGCRGAPQPSICSAQDNDALGLAFWWLSGKCCDFFFLIILSCFFIRKGRLKWDSKGRRTKSPIV